MAPTLTRQEAEDFLYREARLLDERRFDEWLALFTQDAHYWIPCGQGEDPTLVTHLAHDDRRQLEDRVWQLQHSRHSAQNPPSMTSHLVSNVQVEPGPDGQPTINSVFVVRELRRVQGGVGEERALGGHYCHTLRWEDGAWRICLKQAWLLSRDTPISNLTFLL
jgi:benzoate/toluate 1,2-dioxygenase beta subunit